MGLPDGEGGARSLKYLYMYIVCIFTACPIANRFARVVWIISINIFNMGNTHVHTPRLY